MFGSHGHKETELHMATEAVIPCSTKPKARCFQGPNHDVSVRPFIQGQLMGSSLCIGLPRIPDVSRSEFLNESESNATTFGYGVGSSFGTQTFGHEEPYVPIPVANNNSASWYLDSGALIMCVKRRLY